MRSLSQILLFLFCCKALSGQAPVQHISDSLYRLSGERAEETVYLNTNKEVFELEEDLWFGATILHSQHLSPSDLSKTLYVELRSVEDDQMKLSAMYAIENGFTSGHLYLPDSLATGEYWLIGFTANSVRYKDEPIKSVRKILLKEEIVPHVLIQTSFDKEYYINSDLVEGQVRLLSPGGEPVINAKTVISLKEGRKVIDRLRARSDSTGRLDFNLKHKTSVTRLSLSVRMEHQGHQERFDRTIPYDKHRKVQFRFLPEGGNLVAGLSNYVAFKAVDASGYPLDIKKGILLADGEPVTEFKSEHDGMGKFSLFAKPDVDYSVSIVDPPIDSVIEFSEVLNSGVQLSLQQKSKEYLTFGVVQSTDFPLDSVHLMLKQRGVPLRLASGKMKPNGLLLKVPIDQIPQGIVEATLYDRDHRPVAERLVFVGLDKQLEVTVSVSEEMFGVKEKVRLKVSVKDQDGEPVQSVLSLSAIDEMYESPYAETNVLSHFMLSNELKGNIHEPAYYFDKSHAEAPQHLDLLMLTQGWRSYSWNEQELKAQAEKEPLPMVDYVMGRVILKSLTARARKAGVQEVQIISGGGAIVTRTDSLGRFPIIPEFLASSAGSDIVMKVDGQDGVQMSFTTAFDHTEANRSLDRLFYPLKASMSEERNWHKLPQGTAAAKEVMGVEVVDSKQEYGSFNGQNGRYEGNPGDYVCHYNILNCRNHKFGSAPIPGAVYRFGGRMIVYELPGRIEQANTFKAYYKVPGFYQPDYDEKPDEKLIPDFRNTLLWEPNVFTNEKGEAELNFFTSDIRSVFNGKAEGMGANGQFGLVKFKLVVLK
ncbi:MAG: hypothetical protein HEP71_03845 [Roseivirga sp.]|nr:hypothetical protein [Roseivirga sp.]